MSEDAEQLLQKLLARGGDLKAKERLAIPPQDMPAQDADVRNRNFNEVALGYGDAQARNEAMRCLGCKNAPCIDGCPVRINIPAFVGAIADGENEKAIAIVKENSILPAICGRVCPQESQCQAPCTVGKILKSTESAVSIGRLERYVADLERERGIKPPPVKPETGKRVAVVGSGPAGITVAADVRREGHAVTVFEALHKMGGVMVYGIPEFRLPKDIVQTELNTLAAMGVELRTDFVIGRTRRLADLIEKDGFDAAFVGSGAGLPCFMNIEGENLIGVFSANEYLTRSNLMKAYDGEHADTPIIHSGKVAVLGGGNVAMDAARTAKRLGAWEVHLVYRRTEVEMPARIEERHHAKEEGIVFHVLENVKRILGDAQGNVVGMECLRYELGEPDDSGRRRPLPIPGSEFTRDIDAVIIAIGNNPNPLIPDTTRDLAVSKWGTIEVDEETMATSIPGIYAGGDIVTGAATVILAMGQGRIAARSIHNYMCR